MSGYITFRMNGRDLACQLDDVREVVRATGIEPLPGTRAPVSGMIELRNDPLPVVDLRSDAYPGEEGDVLVLNPDQGGSYGVAVDRVLAVVSDDDLVADGEAAPEGLPNYVTQVLRRPEDQAPVMLVELRVLAGLDAASSG
ncbi:MAG TPA: chemotaxis protein CheW [Actinomycetes bacterium]|nr:chemotaxis protein CheW [Actinomycetes bacterium]